MALPSQKTANDFPFKHTGQPDQFGQAEGGDFAAIQALFDSRAEYNQTQINAILTALASVTLGDDGAKAIGLKLAELSSTNVNAGMKELYDAIAGAVLGQIPNNSLTESKMANEMKKMSGGVAPYDDVIFEAGGTFTGTVSHGRNLVQQPKIKDYTENLTTNTTATGTVSIDLSTANVFKETLTGITTFTFDNPAPTGQAHSFTLILSQGSTAYAVTWPSSVKWASDAIPVISDINKTSIFSFVTVDGGTRWYGTAVTKLTT